MTRLLTQLIFSLHGRRIAYRIGRALYQTARGEVANDMTSNGEMLVQRCVVEAWLRDGARENRLVIFDVGANVGDWSAALLKRLADSSVDESTDLYVFEPVPSTVDSLKSRLGYSNSCLHYEQVALSSEDGEGAIHVRGHNAGTNSLYPESRGDDEKVVRISKVTATSFCQAANIQHVHLLKCDTEGHDMEVIRGASPLLAAERIAVLQFEYNHRWVYARNFLRDVFTAIEKLPYKLAKLQSDHLLVFTEWRPELERFFEGNYALIRADALDWFPVRKASFDRFNTMCVERQ